MNGARKILTVSYGTFSCTLEGFDDPFNTMKAIAEYFRDLAAGDRYFGAEPPTPDAAMLHQIAEREIQRRVEAKIQENGVVLTASDQAAPEVAVAAPVLAEPSAPRVVMPAVAAPEQAAPVAQPSLSPVNAPAAETVVEKLSRLRSEIAAQPAAAAAAATAPVVSLALPDYVEDQDDTVPDSAPGTALDTAALADFLPEDEIEPADMGMSLSDLPEDLTTQDSSEEEALTEAPILQDATFAAGAGAEEVPLVEADGVAPDAIEATAETAEEAFDLSAVMDEVAAAETATQPDVTDGADDLPDTLRAVLADATDDEGDIASEAVTDGLEVDAFATPFEDAPAQEVLPATELQPDAFAELSSDGDAIGAGEPESAADAEREIWAETWAEPDTGHPATEDASALAELEPEATVEPEHVADEAPAVEPDQDETAAAMTQDAPVAAMDEATAPASHAAPEPVPGIELRPGAAEKLQRARARVIRIRKGEDAATEALAAPIVAAPQPAPAAEKPVAVAKAPEPDPGSPLLSPEDEAELQRELAALRRSEEERDAAEAAALELQAEQRRGFDGPSADEAVGRLMQQTVNEMEGTETKRRQSAIQHLKAAVAATVADRKVTGDASGEAETVSRLARYRNDLAMAVKAALPGRAGASVPQGERPAPLVLVSEQRIDRPRPSGGPSATAAPIRPRRVTSAGIGMATATDLDLSDDEDEDEDLSNVFDDSKGFAEFVERVGAHGFEQILEASAAYIAGVEGRPHFSRPQLMRHLTAVIPQGSFQREDGLRSFGTLLRDGRLAKVRRGQFTLTEESAYLAEARKLAQ